jgi:predicted DNA-binding transcriptional regulator YafY
MRADRLLSILLLLQAHRRLTAGELARRLEVSPRTIYRDLDALSAAGVPVYAERGSGGGCRLADGYRTNLTGLNDAELQTLVLSKPARLLADLGLRETADAALLKLLAALPDRARREAEQARRRIHIDVTGWNRPDEAAPHLPALQEAIWRERRARLAYRRSDDAAVERLVDPLGLVAKGSVWYLVAGVEGEIRTYRVSRVDAVGLIDEACVRPDDFDLEAYWRQASARFRASLPRYPATVRIDATILARLRHAGGYARIERVEEPDADGWMTLAMDFETEESACAYVLSFGPRIEVVEPRDLREKVVDLAQAVVALYAQQLAAR